MATTLYRIFNVEILTELSIITNYQQQQQQLRKEFWKNKKERRREEMTHVDEEWKDLKK
jgi:hypothetical protein